MDPGFNIHSTSNGFNFDDENFDKFSPDYEQSQNHTNGIIHDYLELDVLDYPDSFAPSSSTSYETESPDDQDSDPVLKFLNQILIEENMEEKPSMFHDPLALIATEKSLYEVLGQQYPSSPHNPLNYDNDPSFDSFFQSSPEYTNSNTAIGIGENNFSGQNFFTDADSIMQFKKGMEEANKFLPTVNPLIIDLDKYELPPKSDDITPSVIVKVEKEKDETEDSPKGLKGKIRKHHYPDEDDSLDMERSSKQSAIYVEDVELSEMFDRVLLCTDTKGKPVSCTGDSEAKLLPTETNGAKSRTKKNETQRDSVDLRTLLISCAQSVASDDRRTAYEQLKQINEHASSTGDVYQRLASVFAIGLEARLGGTGTELYTSLTRRKITAAEKLKAYQVYLSACPFKKASIGFANQMIGLVASEATTLHIVDFGILYGFQWPVLIQHLSERDGDPLKLRITGIEFPQPGFRPTERVEETGIRLAKYCERFGVPFEYQVIATQNWESIKIEDFKIRKGEVLAVNCLFRFGTLLDETVTVDRSPRDACLNLIRSMKPDIFVNAVVSGSYNAPFFVTRFREALFHYSALFDMFDATISRDNPQRMDFEQDFYGREVINVISCEGSERVERPETYKQWQVRHMRAGFKPMPLNNELMKKLRHKVKNGYNKDFLFGEDGNWMLQGWKGRIICASSCWVPA
ncbi:hypothetical protein ABFX02_04G180500 [Erythranthe guttata]